MTHLGKMVALAAAGTFCIATFPHVVPETFKKLMEMEGTPAPKELENHVRKIAAAMHLQKPDHIKVFITSRFSCMSGGTTWLPGGAILGLSRTLLFENKKDVKNSGITLNGKPVNWDTDTGETLQHCLLHSANHVNFCIAHELAHVKSSDFIYYSMLPPAIITVSYFLLMVATPLLPMQLTRITLPAMFGFGMLLYLHVQTNLNFYIEHRADRIAAETHKSFAEGGVEMMTKGIQLNSILNTELGSSRLPFGLGSSHPTFSERLCRLQELTRCNSKKHSI